MKFRCPVCEVEFERYKSQATGKVVCCSSKCAGVTRSRAYTGEANPFFGKKHSAETIAKLSVRDGSHYKTEGFRQKMRELAPNNLKVGMGRGYYHRWVELYGEDGARLREDQRRARLGVSMRGEKNPMYGKPSPAGSGNGWKGWHKGWFFRSLRELTYMVNVIEPAGHQWQNAETAALAIGYRDFAGVERTYYADFLIDGRRLVEVKPRRLMNSPAVMAKAEAAREFCEKNGYEYELVDPGVLDRAVIQQLADDGVVVFHGRYRERFDSYVGA